MTTIQAERQRVWRSRPGNLDREKARRPLYKEGERARTHERRYDLSTWPKVVISNLRHRAKVAGREFTITAADLIVPERCPVLGIPLRVGAGCGGHQDSSPSVDRFDNSKGYVSGNVRVISYRANSIKRDATVEELRRVLAYAEGTVS